MFRTTSTTRFISKRTFFNVISDTAGTVVDKQCLGPLVSLEHTLKQVKICMPKDLLLQNMGISKKLHIQEIMRDPYFVDQWKFRYNQPPDFDLFYGLFCRNMVKFVPEYSVFIPGALEMIRWLNNNDTTFIRLTTNYPNFMGKLVLKKMRDQGLPEDVKLHCFGDGFQTLAGGIKEIIKESDSRCRSVIVGDTPTNMYAAPNNSLKVGVVETSALYNGKNKNEVIQILENSGASITINSFNDILNVLNKRYHG